MNLKSNNSMIIIIYRKMLKVYNKISNRYYLNFEDLKNLITTQ